jgi:dienelactone hydrolase
MTKTDCTFPVMGVEFHGVVVRDEAVSGPSPAVLVLPDGFGISEHSITQAERIAALGYVAMVGEFYGGGRVARDVEEASSLVGDLQRNPTKLRGIIRQSVEFIGTLPGVDPSRLAVVGYCFGGEAALELARSGFSFSLAASFHGVLKTISPAEKGVTRCRILVCTGANDPLVPSEDVAAFQREMASANADFQVIIYGGAGHSFTKRKGLVRPGYGFHADADRRSFDALGQALRECFSEGFRNGG